MHLTLRVLLAGCCLLLGSAAAQAQIPVRGTVEAGGGILRMPQGAATGVSARTRWFITDRVSAGPEFHQWRDAYGRSLLVWAATTSLDFVTWSDELAAAPYLSGTIGVISVADSKSPGPEALVGVSIGVRVRATHRVFISPEVRALAPGGKSLFVSVGWVIKSR